MANPLCKRCGKPMADIHEPWTRARGGPIDDPRNMRSVCRKCHDWIHNNPAHAEWSGWLIPSHEGALWLSRQLEPTLEENDTTSPGSKSSPKDSTS